MVIEHPTKYKTRYVIVCKLKTPRPYTILETPKKVYGESAKHNILKLMLCAYDFSSGFLKIFLKPLFQIIFSEKLLATSILVVHSGFSLVKKLPTSFPLKIQLEDLFALSP